ncbi:LPS-assembly protein LptD [Pelagibius marinus]|uniref:LPS-assembly protein LptD n=1 Tax=Pelagibius marinus TaxID=2762760 RepID=UPI0018729602|nr:LPS assembly protein LptD [Pelagibius marinus]
MAAALYALLAAFGDAAIAQDIDIEALENTPALITADELTYDEENGLVIASGNVEIAQSDRVLLADEVTYNINEDLVTAEGNITLVEPSGDTVFADYVELTGDLKEGFIRDIRILMADKTRIAAASGTRTGGNRTEFSKGVFSPCELCRDDPTRAPLWQIKANEVIHDQESKDIIYHDAWLEFFGIPVIYTPYFEHPDPTVDRRSGFLAPTVGTSDFLGYALEVPYFWVLDDDIDLTVAPILSTEQGIDLTGEYRQLFTNGELRAAGSATIADREENDGSIAKDRFRGHIDAEGQFELDETWRWGFDANRSSDDTYLRAYNFDSSRTLTSTAYLEGLKGRNYAAVHGFSYQGQRRGDSNNEFPIVAPLAEYDFVSEPNLFGLPGGYITADTSLMALTRIDGRDSRRASFVGGYHLPYTSPLGDIYEVTARVQADGYWTDGVVPGSANVNPSNAPGSDTTGRIFPQFAVKWRYPWVRQDGSFQQVIEPIVQAVLAPNGSNPGEIPNEDSQDFEFDDTNLFKLNRFAGHDRVDSGTRFDYGLKWTGAFNNGGSAGAFVGQSYRLSENRDVFAEGSGLEDKFSDIVGRVQVHPLEDLDLLYRFRLDKDDLTAQRSELEANIGPPALNLDLSYFFINGDASTEEFGDREEVSFGINSRLTENWSIGFRHRRDLNNDQSLRSAISLTYEDECFLIEGVAERSNYRDRDIEDDDSIFVRVVFRHLGEASGG